MFTNLSELIMHFEDNARLCYKAALEARNFRVQKEYFAQYDTWMKASTAVRQFQEYICTPRA